MEENHTNKSGPSGPLLLFMETYIMRRTTFNESAERFRLMQEGSLGQKKTERKAKAAAKQATGSSLEKMTMHAGLNDTPKANADYHPAEDPGTNFRRIAKRSGEQAAAKVHAKGERGGLDLPTSPMSRAAQRADAQKRHHLADQGKGTYPFAYTNRMLKHRQRQGQSMDPFNTSERTKPKSVKT